MRVLDYGRSFVTFVSTGGRYRNNARLQIESRTTLTDTRSGESTRYLFFASCKSEDTFAPQDLFYRNNYDFNGIFSDKEYVIFRTYSSHTWRFRDEGLWEGTFKDVNERLVEVEGTVLGDGEEVVRASMAGKPLVGRVELTSEDAALRAEIEFPIKTMNANDTHWKWQVDTGPIALPDFTTDVDLHVKRLSPAFVAYNVDGFADFVVQAPVASPENGSSVTHYTSPITLPAKTSVIAIE
ncbi:MAG: hypothetical protein QF554_11355 [Dehalococcoidia bacterium]|jgi:hypothetical protein|nr:hypothetical protein [Dehalococcoidia bacterium]